MRRRKKRGGQSGRGAEEIRGDDEGLEREVAAQKFARNCSRRSKLCTRSHRIAQACVSALEYLKIFNNKQVPSRGAIVRHLYMT